MLFSLFPFRVGKATIYRAYGSALGLFMKSHAFGTFIRNNIIKVFRNRRVLGVNIGFSTVLQYAGAGNFCAVRNGPFHTTLIDGVVRAFGLASSTVDALISYHYSHRFSFFLVNRLGQDWFFPVGKNKPCDRISKKIKLPPSESLVYPKP